MQSGSQRYGKEDRWQLPGLTASDAFKPEDWQSFCTKVDVSQQPGESSWDRSSVSPDSQEVICTICISAFLALHKFPTDDSLSCVC